MRRLPAILAAFGLLLAAPAAAITIFYQDTIEAVDGLAAFNGGFDDATAYPHTILARNYRITVDTGAINEISWEFDPEEQRLWWERIAADEPFMMNGNEYNQADQCDVEPGGTCTTNYGGVTLTGNVGRVRQDASAIGFDACAAVLPGLIAADFIGISSDCAVTFVARHNFGIAVAAAGPVTLTIAAIPEPGTWALLLTGFGLIGGAMRRVSPAPRPAP